MAEKIDGLKITFGNRDHLNEPVHIENKKDFGLVVPSRVVADELSKNHKDVLRDLDNMIASHGADLGSEIFESEYKNSRGRTYREYLLTKDGFTLYMFNIQGHNEFKMAYINKFNEMERQIESQSPKLPGTYKEALLELVAKEEENEKLYLENSVQKQQIGELKPKATYYDVILKNKSLITVRSIAKDYGMSPQALNTLLNELGVQYKQSSQWFLYAKYQAKGYTHSEPVEVLHSDGTVSIKMNTKWTQKGRLFLYELLKKDDILPMIEREDVI